MRILSTTVSEQVSKPNSGVPLFGHTIQLRVFVNPDLLQYDIVWAAAGTWNRSFATAPNELVRLSDGAANDLERG